MRLFPELFPLVVQLFPLRQSDLALHSSIFEIELGWDQGESLLLHLAE